MYDAQPFQFYFFYDKLTSMFQTHQCILSLKFELCSDSSSNKIMTNGKKDGTVRHFSFLAELSPNIT